MNLSEDRIKTIALRFLKGYYKFRPRMGETQVRKDMQARGGIIIDGILKYKDDKNKEFLATVEATSVDKIEEVKYTVQWHLMFWDGLAFSLMMVAFLKSFAYESNMFTIKHIGLWANVGILLGSVMLLWMLYFLIFRFFSRYRYIYAVEQFKRYHADEQWIAMAEDVFNNPENPYLKELKHQCVYNGFGLVMIDTDEEAHLHIT
ncbi:MAG: hypothetical protein AAFO94_18590, partial [Bacteroidota bacterium]